MMPLLQIYVIVIVVIHFDIILCQIEILSIVKNNYETQITEI